MSDSPVHDSDGLGRVARDLVETQGVAPTLRAVVAKTATLLSCKWAVVAVTRTLTDNLPA
ncbi:hypothetical protein GCM10025782_20640 [Pedococcus ginsenosidimutans]|uniref:Uncharacterized protein n=1 Tax=Pedococcus ginsenosidimutans TaxID=490570 RepID=A0ABP8Y9R9_9MICO